MAEERIEIPVTPERTNLKGGNLRNSMGKSSMSSSREKIIPHYLRASTGSCHDFCKYGRKHAFEAKGKHHIPRGNTTSPAEGEYPVNSATLTEKKKKPVIKLRRSSDPVEGGYPINSATLAETKKKPLIKPRRSLDLVEDEYPVNSATLAERKTKPVIKLRRSSDPVEDKYPVNSATLAERKLKPLIKPRRSSDLVEDECPVNSATLAERKTKPVIKLRRSPDLKTQLLNKAEIIKPKVYSPEKTIELSAKQVFSPAKRSDASTKPATALKSKSVATKSSSFPVDLSGGLGSRRNNDIKIMRNMGNSKTGGKKALMPQTASVSPRPSVSRVASSSTRRYRNLKAVSPLKNQNKVKMAEPKLVNPYEVREKTLYVIEQSENKCLEPVQTKTPTRLSPSSLSSSSISLSSPSLSSHVEEEYEESELTHSEANDSISEYDETENKNQSETMNAEHKRRGRGAMVVQHEDKDCSPQKLNFRRGKVINLQTENNGPRRLRFRQGRMLGENQNGKGEIGRRSFRRRKEAPDGDLDGTKPKSEQVVLRHQDLQGKKDAQGLFNNVIEETASKLVETRKSKVKALVGAFETVISLQESKPTTTSTG